MDLLGIDLEDVSTVSRLGSGLGMLCGTCSICARSLVLCFSFNVRTVVITDCKKQKIRAVVGVKQDKGRKVLLH